MGNWVLRRASGKALRSILTILFFFALSSALDFNIALANDIPLDAETRMELETLLVIPNNASSSKIDSLVPAATAQKLIAYNNSEIFEKVLHRALKQLNDPKSSPEFNYFMASFLRDFFMIHAKNESNSLRYTTILVNNLEFIRQAESTFTTKNAPLLNKKIFGPNYDNKLRIDRTITILRGLQKIAVEGRSAYLQFAMLPKKSVELLSDLQEMRPIKDYSAISALREYSDPRIVEVALWRMDQEVRNKGTVDVNLIEALTYLLQDYLGKNSFDKGIFLEFSQEINAIRTILVDRVPNENLRFLPVLDYFVSQVNSITVRDIGSSNYQRSSSTALMVLDNGRSVDPDAKLQKFKEFLDKRIIEQPEVKKALYSLEYETLIKGRGNNAEPAFFYLMGLPGVGKDTSAEAYIDALEFLEQARPTLAKQKRNTRDHIFSVPLQRSKADAWTLLGSATGYKGSDDLSPLIRFLVLHSAGRYKITGGRNVVENEHWKPGMVIDGYYEPERAVIFLNEFHNWSSEAKAVVMKESLEKGIFKINNPGSGLNQIEIRGIRFIAASNEGIELYTNRDADGARFGEQLSYEEMMERWERVAHDKDLLRQTIAKTASKNSYGTPGDEKVGTPEEILSRIHPSRMILMRPISPEGLKQIVRIHVEKINEQLKNSDRGIYGSFEIRATERLVEFIQEYGYSAEEGARPIRDRVRSLMEYPFYEALKDSKIKPFELVRGVTLDYKRNENKTYSLVLLKGFDNPTQVMADKLMEETLKERDNKPISDEKIERFLDLGERLKDRVFGAEKAIELISKAMLLSEEARHTKKTRWSDHQKATSFAFLGPSSTGKSEMAKALVNELYPSYGEQRRVDIDFNKIQSPHHMEEYIWGRKEGRNVVPSEFMKKYDQFNGDILFVFEESSNTPKELLRSLYDLFRENHPKFADGKDRPMTNVTIILTGNAGIEWYSNVPKDIPEDVRMAAWSMIYERAMKSLGKTRSTLEKYYPEPLINRIGEQNIIWFSPLDFKALRELTWSKTNIFIDKLKATNGRRGWTVGFRNAQEYNRTIEIFEREGFVLEEQGASLDRYIDIALNKDLRALLLTNKIESGKRVALVPRADQTEAVITKNEKVLMDVVVEGLEKPLVLSLYAKKREVYPRENRNDLIMTAIHEAGHEFVGRLLLGDKHKSDFISIIPGVAEINGQWIYYLGVRSANEVERLAYTKEAIERVIAGLLAGEVAQSLFSKGFRHDAGKGNDIERATEIAQRAVGEWGLSSVWGNRVVKKDQITSLSDADRKIFDSEVKKILNRSRTLAVNTIAQNKEVFSELAYELLEKGEIKSQGLEEYYKKNASRILPVTNQEKASQKVYLAMLPAQDKDYNKSHNVEPVDSFRAPENIASIQNIVQMKKEAMRAKARRPKHEPILESFTSHTQKALVIIPQQNRAQNLSCSQLFH